MSGSPNNPKNKLIDQKPSAHKAKPVKNHLPSHADYHDDYEQIKAAVLETKRGRWFLDEFGRKNKQIESKLVLDALAAIETKISAAPKLETKPKAIVEKAPIATAPQADFETEQQSSQFAQLFANFKHKTIKSLKWAGINNSLKFSKISTILDFASNQTRASVQTQEKKLNLIIGELQNQNIDSIIIEKLRSVSTELCKLEELQGHLNEQLADGLKFIGQVENITQNIEPNLEIFSPKVEQKTPKNDEKTAQNSSKTAEKQLKTAKNELKVAKKALETLKNEPPKPKIGPVGRIKKMFKIEQTLQVQQAEDIVEPGKAFDEAFANQRLNVKPQKPAQIQAEAPAEISQPEPTQITKQSEKLATLSDMMKQVDDIKHTMPTADADEQETKIIIDKDFNALNSLALLSKTERTMLFTLQN